MKRIKWVAAVCAFASCTVFGQTTAAMPAFEVASIKHSAPPTDGRLMVRMGGDPGRVNFTNVTLRNLMMQAYGVKDTQIVGPDWMSAERYDVIAKLPEGAPKEQIPQMLQGLLADRFQLTLHRETKVMPVYELVVSKSGIKAQAAEPAVGFRMMMGPKGRHITGKATLTQLADMLSNFLDRPVIDKTGTAGGYDIDMEWSGDEGGGLRLGPGPMGGGSPHRQEGGSDDKADGPTVFTAVQEKLGLRLEAQKAPVEILTVDHVEKLPTEN